MQADDFYPMIFTIFILAFTATAVVISFIVVPDYKRARARLDTDSSDNERIAAFSLEETDIVPSAPPPSAVSIEDAIEEEVTLSFAKVPPRPPAPQPASRLQPDVGPTPSLHVDTIQTSRPGPEPHILLQPTSSQHSPTALPSYPALRLISKALKYLGWTFLAIAAHIFVILIYILGALHQQSGFGFFGPFIMPMFISAILLALAFGVGCLAFSELIKVFLDIAAHTAQVSNAILRSPELLGSSRSQNQ